MQQSEGVTALKGAESGDAPAVEASSRAAGNRDADQIAAVKARMSRLRLHDKELLLVIDRANEVYEAEVERATADEDEVEDVVMPMLREMSGVAALTRARAVRDAAIERVTAEREAVRADMASAESEFDALVRAPVSGGRDPFEWLPDELIVMIMVRLPFEVLQGSVCERVCQRWERLMERAPVQRQKRDGRWAAYEAGAIKPRTLEHGGAVYALAVGLTGKVYSGSDGMMIQVWSVENGSHIQTLVGHRAVVSALAVGLTGKVYSGSYDRTIRVWSGDDGTHLKTLVGHSLAVSCIAVGLDGKVYSGSHDGMIRVWSGDNGTHLKTLVGHSLPVSCIAAGLDGKVYSGSLDKMIRVWSGDDGTHLKTLVGHSLAVSCIAAGLDGKVYSGSHDGMIRVWSGDDGTHLKTLAELQLGQRVLSLATGPKGIIFSCLLNNTVQVRRCGDGALLYTLRGDTHEMYALAVTRDGTLFSGGIRFRDDDDDDDDEDDDTRVGIVNMW
jgi:hypothetical protein